MLPKRCSKGNNNKLQTTGTAKMHGKSERSKFAFEIRTHTRALAHTHRQTLTQASVHTRIVNTGLRTKPQYGACFNFTCDAWMALYV